MKKTIFKSKQTVVFFGDSITDCGRFEPEHAPLGCGYVNNFNDLLLIHEPEKEIKIMNRGIGGNTIDDLQSRLVDDVLCHNPDHLFIKIGINDINQYLFQNINFLSPEGFQKIYERMMTDIKAALPKCEITLISPFFISKDTREKLYRGKVLTILSEYINVVELMHKKFETKYLNTHKLFQNQLEFHHPDVYCQEPVHPNSAGHLLLAEAIYAICTVA
ncbi:SGNH/GDSL hydrolase family protein [bacterium]|nr:SGNH/GDSL hydrolase family protein [bacterium]